MGIWEQPAKADLKQWYEAERMSASQIASAIGEQHDGEAPDARTVLRWLHAAGIPVRSDHASRVHPATPPVSADELRAMYEDDKMSTYAIAKKQSTSASTVQKWLRAYGIEPRGVGRPPKKP